MAEKLFGDVASFKAAADLSSHQWKHVKLTAANTVNICSAATDRAIGILLNKPKSGEAAEVLTNMGNIVPMVADGSGTAIAVGDMVGPNASAVAVKKATADFNTTGMAMEAASAANVVINVMYFGPGVFRSLGG